MIKIEKTDVYGWESAIRGMRNSWNSWNKSDSFICYEWNTEEDCADCTAQDTPYCGKMGDLFVAGQNDLALMKKLSKAGTDHSKFMRMINVTCDITAPLYWWKEFDTYKVGTVANSCSTMHTITEKEFDLDDFSREHLFKDSDKLLWVVIMKLNYYRDGFLKTNNKKYWWQIIQLLPSSYNQKRTIHLNYQVLKSMYHARKNHKLDEWREFCEWIETLPYAEELICCE